MDSLPVLEEIPAEPMPASLRRLLTDPPRATPTVAALDHYLARRAEFPADALVQAILGRAREAELYDPAPAT